MINKETTKTKEIKLDQRFFEEDTFKVEKSRIKYERKNSKNR